MKKFLALVLAALMVFAFVACNGTGKDNNGASNASNASLYHTLVSVSYYLLPEKYRVNFGNDRLANIKSKIHRNAVTIGDII